MQKSRNLLYLLAINLVVLLLLSELVFTTYYFWQDGRYVSVTEKLAAEKSSFDVEKTGNLPCNKHKGVLVPHPYLAFVHLSRPECDAPANNTGHRGPDVPLIKNRGDYVVMILGGSVANQLYQFKKDEIRDYFQKKMPHKNIIILNGSLEGWKQPQQLFMLQMYGEVLDAAISIEGFNEMIFNRRLDYSLRFEAPFIPGYRKANTEFQTEDEHQAISLSSTLFDLVNDHALLRHSKTAYFISEKFRQHLEDSAEKENDLASLQTGKLSHLGRIFILPSDWSTEQKRDYAIAQYIKYLQLMNASAQQYHISLAVFIQPAPALYKNLTAVENKVVGELDYKNDYLLFEKLLLQERKTIPVYSLLDVFAGVDDTIYRDGIHYREESAGPELVMARIYQVIDKQWKFN